jgi:gamma-glutamylcyclotransferase (GGCT)/AIG2-like uncharacterized protein YtfP
MAGVRLFVYGTLLDPARLQGLTGRRFPTRPARLRDFERVAPPGGYPYLVARPGAAVDGLVLEDVDPASLRALDAYEDEGQLYVRRTVEVDTGDGPLTCEVYVANPGAFARARRRHPASDG